MPEIKRFHTFPFFAKGRRKMTSGCQWTPYFRRYGPEAGFKTRDFVKEKLGRGYRRTTHWKTQIGQKRLAPKSKPQPREGSEPQPTLSPRSAFFIPTTRRRMWCRFFSLFFSPWPPERTILCEFFVIGSSYLSPRRSCSSPAAGPYRSRRSCSGAESPRGCWGS